MKTPSLLLLSVFLALRASATPGAQAEIGASYFALRHSGLEGAANVLSVDEPGKFAPFLAARYGFNDRFALRLSWHFLKNVRATATSGAPAGTPPSVPPFVVWTHMHDDIHVLSAAPEIAWRVSPKVTFALAPQLNWVASRGTVSYSTLHPLILLPAPQARRDDGFALGGNARLLRSLGGRAALSVGYQFLNLDPSFGRQAHVISGGLQWRF